MKVLKDLFGSKKFLAALAGVLVAILNDVTGRPVSEESVYTCLAIIGTYIGAQGLADMGKEKEKIASEKDPTKE